MIVNCNMFRNEMIEEGTNSVNLLISYSLFAIRAGSVIRSIPGKSNYNINPDLFSVADDLLIVFDSGIKDAKILQRIEENNKDKRLIFYYWNPVTTTIHPKMIPEKYERWSYSPDDCRLYEMRYNSTFYFECFANKKVDFTDNTDICFIGKDKGRKKVLQKLKQMLEDAGLTTNFYITATHPRFQRVGYQKKVSYKESLNITLGSTCILDYYSNPMAGLSLRAMESIFLGRKLITNNKTIKDYDFYHPDNIYMIENEQRSLHEFIETPMVEIDENIVKGYLFANWLGRFGG